MSIRPEDKKKIEEYIQKYPSVRIWFIKPNGERRYKLRTEKANLECLEIWIDHVNKNPDKLVPSTLDEAETIQRKILAKAIELSLDLNAILQHTTKYHSFCRFNGFKFSYGGDKIRNILRSAKVDPSLVANLLELKERKRRAGKKVIRNK